MTSLNKGYLGKGRSGEFVDRTCLWTNFFSECAGN